MVILCCRSAPSKARRHEGKNRNIQAIQSHDRDCKADENKRIIRIKKEKMVVLKKKKKTKTEAMFMRLTRTEVQYFLGNCMGSEFVWGS